MIFTALYVIGFIAMLAGAYFLQIWVFLLGVGLCCFAFLSSSPRLMDAADPGPK